MSPDDLRIIVPKLEAAGVPFQSEDHGGLSGISVTVYPGRAARLRYTRLNLVEKWLGMAIRTAGPRGLNPINWRIA